MSDATHPGGESNIALTDEIKSVVDSALSAGHPVAIAYVGRAGEPHLSLRGTVQVFGPDQLALWNRGPGLPECIAVNPYVALLYVDLTKRTHLRFSGRAHVADDDATRTRVFAASPPGEQAQDPNRHGIAVIVDLDLVRGITQSGPINMAR